jgi:hypothetical protein
MPPSPRTSARQCITAHQPYLVHAAQHHATIRARACRTTPLFLSQTTPLVSCLHWCRLVANACSRGLTSPHAQPAPASRSRGSVAAFSALLPFYASPCSAASRWWRIALAPGFVETLCRIASLQHARSPDNRGFSRSLSNTLPRLHAAHRPASLRPQPRTPPPLALGPACGRPRAQQTRADHSAADA